MSEEAETNVVVVTGASSGIGEAITLRLAERGERLVLAARRRGELERVAAEARERGAEEVLVVPTDVTNRSEVRRLYEAAVGGFGRVDVWVNNAGRGIVRNVLELTEEEFDSMMAVNAKSALYGAQVAVPHFVERGRGHLLNVSSFLGRVPAASERSAYNAAKAALNALTANLRMDLARYPGVHVSLVMPGIVDTGFARNALGAEEADGRGGGMPAQPVAEVADAVVGLIEDPRPELYTDPVLAGFVRRYFEDVGAFEAQMAARG